MKKLLQFITAHIRISFCQNNYNKIYVDGKKTKKFADCSLYMITISLVVDNITFTILLRKINTFELKMH